jgi:hypothetical protein
MAYPSVGCVFHSRVWVAVRPAGRVVPVVRRQYRRLLVVPNGGTGGITMIAFRSSQPRPEHDGPP